MCTEERFVWTDLLSHIYKQEVNTTVFKNAIKEDSDYVDVDVDKAVDTFVSALYSAGACMTKTVGKKSKVKNWFDYECLQKKRMVKQCLRKFRKTDNIYDKEVYVKEKKEYRQILKQKKNDFEKKRLENLMQNFNSSNIFWKTVRSINHKSLIYHHITPEQWYEHFSKLFALNDSTQGDEVDDTDLEDVTAQELDNPITKEEVMNSIHRLKTGKSAGPDKIVSEMLKNAKVQIADFLVGLFNKLFHSGKFPTEWSKSIIVPIHKKGDVNIPDNYRGVTLSSVLSKVYTDILNRRLSYWCDQEKTIIEEQAGFRSGYSTIDHIFTLYAIVQKYLMKNKKLYVAFVDFKKAFDSVDRNALWNILRKNHINGRFYKAIKGIYASVLACVRDTCRYTDSFCCPKWVKQGCLLSPMLFSLLINEMAIEIAKMGKHGIQMIPGAIEIFLLLFADDVILFSSTVMGLQNQIDLLKKEADSLHLEVNLGKTNIMVFRKGGYLGKREKWKFGGEDLKVTNSYKYLGMIFTTKLCITSILSAPSIRAKRSVIEIIKVMKRLGSSNPALFWKLFDTKVEPLLTYSAEIWGLENISLIENVHTFAIKRFFNVPLHSSNLMLYGETGRYPLFVRTSLKCIKYWLKLTKMSSYRFPRMAYEMLLTQNDLGKFNWVSRVKKLLIENGFGIVWLSQAVGSHICFVNEFKDRIIEIYKQNWHAKIESDDKYKWFNSFKDVFVSEKYLMYIENRKFRDALLRFRLRVFGFNNCKVWYKTEINESVCPMCGQNNEDEIHVLFVCKYYEEIRGRCGMKLNYMPGWIDVFRLLSSKSNIICRNLSKFISLATDLRKEKILSSET